MGKFSLKIILQCTFVRKGNVVFSKINVQRNLSYSVTNKMKKKYSAILGSFDLLIKTKHYDEHVKSCVQNALIFIQFIQ